MLAELLPKVHVRYLSLPVWGRISRSSWYGCPGKATLVFRCGGEFALPGASMDFSGVGACAVPEN